MSVYPNKILRGSTANRSGVPKPMPFSPKYGQVDGSGRRWNGGRWVSKAEWELALRIKQVFDESEAYYNLPWYKRIFRRRP